MRITGSALVVATAMVMGLSGTKAQIVDEVVVPEDVVVSKDVVVPEDFVLQKGFSELIELPGAVDNVAVGDPEIVDVAPMSANAFLLNAVEVGTTNILVLDPEGQLLYRARVHVRPVETWPAYDVNVTYGTALAHSYTCDPNHGCPARPPEPPPELPPVNYIVEGTTTINSTADGTTTTIESSTTGSTRDQ